MDYLLTKIKQSTFPHFMDEEKFRTLSKYIDTVCSNYVNFYKDYSDYSIGTIIDNGSIIKVGFLMNDQVDDRYDYLYFENGEFYSMGSEYGYNVYVKIFNDDITNIPFLE